MTTISADEMDRLTEIADNIPDGFLGVDDLERVAVPNTNIYGVRVGNVSDNRPAIIAGMQDGDIIIEFGGVPIRTPASVSDDGSTSVISLPGLSACAMLPEFDQFGLFTPDEVQIRVGKNMARILAGISLKALCEASR